MRAESARWMFSLLERGLELELVVWLEKPAGSWMFKLREWEAHGEVAGGQMLVS